jgi:pimeloyl-ACP methyl ester carboxylesterase
VAADRFVDVQGARVRFRAEGHGPPVLLIHGIGACLEIWDWTFPALRERFTPIAFDYPGFGASDPLPWAFSPEGAADVITAFMDAVGLRTAFLVGSSLGGGIATMTAGLAPTRVEGLVLVAPAGFGRGLNPLLRLETAPLLGEGLAALAGVFPGLALREAFADRRRIPPALVDVSRRYGLRRGPFQAYLRALRRSATLGGVRAEMVATVRAAARRIIAPTLIVWGDRDRVIPPDQATVAAHSIKGSRLHMMKGVGHVPFVEAPAPFNTAAVAFLVELERPASAKAAH